MKTSAARNADLVCLVLCVIPPARVELGDGTTHPKAQDEGWQASQGHKENRRLAPEELLKEGPVRSSQNRKSRTRSPVFRNQAA